MLHNHSSDGAKTTVIIVNIDGDDHNILWARIIIHCLALDADDFKGVLATR